MLQPIELHPASSFRPGWIKKVSIDKAERYSPVLRPELRSAEGFSDAAIFLTGQIEHAFLQVERIAVPVHPL